MSASVIESKKASAFTLMLTCWMFVINQRHHTAENDGFATAFHAAFALNVRRSSAPRTVADLFRAKEQDQQAPSSQARRMTQRPSSGTERRLDIWHGKCPLRQCFHVFRNGTLS
jgi:hypothetical protein